jgi:hypothetical protein
LTREAEPRPPIRVVAAAYGVMLKMLLVVAAMAVALTGCAFPTLALEPTALPPDYVPTAVHLTAAAIEAITMSVPPPTPTLTATATFLAPTLEPTSTATPGPPVPRAAIQVTAPGPMSKLVSPIQVRMLVLAGDSKRVEVDLLGEDGRMLGRTLTAVPGDPDGDPVSLKIPFEIRAAGENGYLQVSTKDGNGRVVALITVPVILLSAGESQVNPPGDTVYERIAVADLPPESAANGGVLTVKGDMLPFSTQPMILELIADAGQELSLRVLSVTGPGWQPFQTTMPFRVTEPTSARLFAHEADDVLEGDVYVYSQSITLNP